MAKSIKVKVAELIATTLDAPVIVCGNSDYTITFEFDSAWDGYTSKTARFVYKRDGEALLKYEEVAFVGEGPVAVPMMTRCREVYVGVYAGDLHTTTPARIPCEKSILCSDPVHDEPAEDVYHQIMELFNNLDNLPLGDLEVRVATLPYGVPGSGSIGGTPEAPVLHLGIPSGAPFSVARVYDSVSSMQQSYATDGVPVGGFVVIDTGNTANSDHGALYFKGSSVYEYLCNLKNFTGITGPQGAQGFDGPQGPTGKEALTFVHKLQMSAAPVTGGTSLIATTMLNRTPEVGESTTVVWHDTTTNRSWLVACEVDTVMSDNTTRIRVKSFAETTGPQGEVGEQGPQGETGEPAFYLKKWATTSYNDPVEGEDFKMIPVDAFSRPPVVGDTFVCFYTARTELYMIECGIRMILNGYAYSTADKVHHIIDKYAALPAATVEDAGKFLRVSADGEWVAETVPSAEGGSF